MGMRLYKSIVAILILSVCFLCACGTDKKIQAPKMKPSQAAWSVYWDWANGIDEAQDDKYQDVIVFAADFDSKSNIVLPKKFNPDDFKDLSNRKLFISFVNDIQTQSSGTIQKDIVFLNKLLETPESRRQHISDVIKICRDNGFDGIEIDYENIWKEKALVENFVSFVKELHKETQMNLLDLRVVLDVRALKYAKIFPDDVEYVVMFYNLYGLHSGPGPKADKEFILNTLEKMQNLKGTPNIAFANGGFDWCEGSKTRSLTSKQARLLAKRMKVEPKRDFASNALYFTYMQNDKKHTVWYGDETTIEYWCDIAKQYGYKRFSLWRLGGSK
jgi:hypothetical protein